MNNINFSAEPQNDRMSVLNEQIYGYKHGIRPLVLQTINADKKDIYENRIKREGIDYVIKNTPNRNNLNLFFGETNCIDVIKSFGNVTLNKLSPEKDFMLGILLGYDKSKQCERYLKMKQTETIKLNKKEFDVVV